VAPLTGASREVVAVPHAFRAGARVLHAIDLAVAKGEMVALIGASGSGKSTLIRAIAGLIAIDRPEQPGDRRDITPASGRIRILGEQMQEDGRICASAARLRARIGVIFQQFNLVPRLSVLTNVCLALLGQIQRWRGTRAR